MIVGTSTNRSTTLRGRRRGQRFETRPREILGTAITCSTSAGASIFRRKSTTRSPNCGTGTSRICTKGEKSTMCATVCRRTPSCGRTSTRGVGRAASTSPSSSSVKNSVLAALESSGPWRCSSLSPFPWPLPPSVSVELSGGSSRQRPLRRSSAQAATWNGAVALFVAVQLLNWAAR